MGSNQFDQLGIIATNSDQLELFVTTYKAGNSFAKKRIVLGQYYADSHEQKVPSKSHWMSCHE